MGKRKDKDQIKVQPKVYMERALVEVQPKEYTERPVVEVQPEVHTMRQVLEIPESVVEDHRERYKRVMKELRELEKKSF